MNILKMGASWCTSCKTLTKMIGTIDIDTSIEITEIDIDDQFDLATKYSIRSVPTMIKLDDDGKEVSRLVGAPKTTTELKNWLYD